MKLTGLHLLLTYKCVLECDHCFVWGSPWQTGTMTLQVVREILQQAEEIGTVQSIYFEGGEPFLFYATLLKGVQEAAAMGFQVGIVSNGYWAISEADAIEWLRPFAGLVQDLSVSSDLYHWNETHSQQATNANAAAASLGIPVGFISVAQPEAVNAAATIGQLPAGESAVMYRGRAVEKLAAQAVKWPWEQFNQCPYEDLREPGRLHVDPMGNLHICQGITLGNLFQAPLKEICATYDPNSHPITSHLIAGGPAALINHYGLAHEAVYADACHLCNHACGLLRSQFPQVLGPDQMYGEVWRD